MHPDLTYFPVLLSLSPHHYNPASLTEEDKMKRKKKTYCVQFVLPIFSMEYGQTPNAQTVKENWVLPYLPLPEAINYEELQFGIPLTFFKEFSSKSSCLDCYFFMGRNRERGCQRRVLCLSIPYMNLQSWTQKMPKKKRGFLILYVQQQCRLWTSNGFWRYHKPRTFMWPPCFLWPLGLAS